MPLGTLIGLIVCNVIWSMHPVMGKLLLADFSPVHAAWIRYTGAFVAFALIALCWPILAKGSARSFGGTLDPSRRRALVPRGTHADFWIIGTIGVLTFCLSPLLQMSGLSQSRATDSALIVAMEPIAIVFLARIMLGERLQAQHWVAFILAGLGFVLLTGITPERLAGGFDPHLSGNLILLISLFGEAAFSVLGRKLVGRVEPAAVFAGASVAGTAAITIAVFLLSGLPDLSRLTAGSVLGLLWLGPFGTTITYLYWMFALTRAPVASLAVSLFIQPLLGSVWGRVFLGDQLSLLQWSGGALIVLGVLSQVRAQSVR